MAVPFLSFQVHGIRIQPRHSRDGVGHLVTKSDNDESALEGGKRACVMFFENLKSMIFKQKKKISALTPIYKGQCSASELHLISSIKEVPDSENKHDAARQSSAKTSPVRTWKAAAGYSKWYCHQEPRVRSVRFSKAFSPLIWGKPQGLHVFEWLKQSMHYILYTNMHDKLRFQRKQNIIQSLIPKLNIYIYIYKHRDTDIYIWK